uniref:Retrovirus-related Pol polyprotein from transposon TNT 1-94-like beta-barrel domain-containing protein n=1 Tax=Salix viminalis TaxID=40686 RepID=A0A6N2LVF6_SALVM
MPAKRCFSIRNPGYRAGLQGSFRKQDRKRLGYGALAASLLITFSFFTVFNPYLGSLPLCKSSTVLALQLSELFPYEHVWMKMLSTWDDQKLFVVNDSSSCLQMVKEIIPINDGSSSQEAVEPSIAMASSSTTETMNSATSLEISLPKSHLPDVIPVLRGYGLLGYVKNEVPCPASTITGESGMLQANPAASMWLRTDQLILGWINSSLSDGPLSQVINSESSHDAWQVLETLYGTHTRYRIQQIKGELQTLTKGARTTAPSMAFYTNRGRTNPKPWMNHGTRGRNQRNFTGRHSTNSNSLRARETRFPQQSGSFTGIRQKQTPHNNNRGRGGITCFRCGGPNHKADGCFAPEEEADQYKAFAAIKIGETTEEPWYSDTGANQHMTSNTNEVQGIISYPGHESVMVGNGQDLSITGTGHIILPTTKLKLNDVLVVPEIKKKLLSVSQFTRDNNCYFLFYPWGFILKDMKTKQVLLKGFVKDGLYPINLQQLSTAPVSNSSSQIAKFIAHLSAVFHMKDLGDIHYFLEMVRNNKKLINDDGSSRKTVNGYTNIFSDTEYINPASIRDNVDLNAAINLEIYCMLTS